MKLVYARLLRRLATTNNNTDSFERAIGNSYLISADQVHALHPNYVARHEVKFYLLSFS